MTAAIFLDRDGVINEKMPEGEYVSSPEEFRLLPGAVEAIRRLNDAGYLVLVVTNQRGIARGELTEADLTAIHEKLTTALHAAGAHLDGIYVCPHEKGSCDCRKPKPGLLLQAKADFPQIDFSQSVMIGDSESDIQAGQAVGCGRCIRIGIDCETKTLAQAANLVLERM